MNGKICMITGANSGIGKSTALGLAKMGATILMVCRNTDKGKAAMDEIVKISGNESVDLMIADLSSQKSIRRLAQEFKERYKNLHALVNNAGLIIGKRSMTQDGIEATFALNHLAYFTLTDLLLDTLKDSAPSRIVNVSSEAHRRSNINFDDLGGEKRYREYIAYGQSKLANILFTYELARRLEGSGVSVNCLQPGFVRSNFGESSSGLFRFGVRLAKPFSISPEKGAETPIYLASSPEVEGISGKYFIKKKETRSSEETYDEEAAKRLWEISAEMTKR